MAVKKEKTAIDNKELNSFLDGYKFEKPEILEDGTIKTPRYKTGIMMFDILTNGGLPHGKVIAIGAEPGCGKTTIVIQMCGNIIEQYPDKKVYYIDAEGGATYELFEAMGFANLLYDKEDNPDGRLYLVNASTIQDIAKIINRVTKDPNTAVIVIDSDTQVVDALALEEEDLGSSNKAAASDARMWSKNGKLLSTCIKNSEACLILIHQARVDLSQFRARIVATGGNAAKHMASAEIFGKRKGWIGKGNVIVKDKAEAIGALVKFNTEKNRLTRPFAAVMLPIFFGRGVSNMWAYKSWLESHEYTDTLTGEVKPFISKKGSWFVVTLPDGTSEKVQGDGNVWAIIENNFDAIKEYIDSKGGFELEKSEKDGDFVEEFDE